jgi:hypothetical protein
LPAGFGLGVTVGQCWGAYIGNLLVQGDYVLNFEVVGDGLVEDGTIGDVLDSELSYLHQLVWLVGDELGRLVALDDVGGLIALRVGLSLHQSSISQLPTVCRI